MVKLMLVLMKLEDYMEGWIFKLEEQKENPLMHITIEQSMITKILSDKTKPFQKKTKDWLAKFNKWRHGQALLIVFTNRMLN